MKKYIISLIILSATFHANAMEIEVKSSETKEQFIERTRHQPSITPEQQSFFDKLDLKCEHYSFSPHETKLAAIVKEKNCPQSSVRPQIYLMIIALHRGYLHEVLLKRALSFDNNVQEYNRVALSSDDSKIATFYENIMWENDGRHSQYILKVKKIARKGYDITDKQEIEFPFHFYPTMIAFNKQGTLLIARNEYEFRLFDVQ
ncbi:MAG TPA: hypothetical protein VHX42_00945 [Candidatus Babeliales bacterium]|nr:hypothetical protein [Candidatus Babeliales bacterium]